MSKMQTISRTVFDIANPDPDLIFIDDIVYALGRINRFGGHTVRNYSVLRHSLAVYFRCPTYPKEALLHDAAEAYIGDITQPVKQAIGPAIREVEDRVQRAIAERFHLVYPFPQAVKDADTYMLIQEAHHLFDGPCFDWDIPNQEKDPDYDFDDTFLFDEHLFKVIFKYLFGSWDHFCSRPDEMPF